MHELSVYDLKEVVEVELYCDEFLTINGVDIPLPCHARIDLVAKTQEDKIVIIDHKSKAIFTDEKELPSYFNQHGNNSQCAKPQAGKGLGNRYHSGCS